MKQKLILLTIILLALFLRLYHLSSNPPALYWDEASLGYNAYSILVSGHDEHGEFMPLTHFTAFGDYKPPGYIYATALSLKLFGVNEFAIRLPSALAGVGMVLLTYLLVKKLFGGNRAALIAALLLTISPWSLQLSRAAFEAHLAVSFNLLAIYLFVCAVETPWMLPFSFVSFVLSFYTFNSNRILAPLFIGVLTLIYFKQVWKLKRWYTLSVIIAVVLMLPNISYLSSRESRIRFQEVSIFTSLVPVEKANERIAREGGNIIAQIIHNRRWYYLKDFLVHYTDNFRGEFLFISGDVNARLSIQEVGELYLFELPLVLVGLYILLRYRNQATALIIGWMLIAPIPAGMARETPHMLRIASILPTYQILGALGLLGLWLLLKRLSPSFRRTILLGVGILIMANILYYEHQYWVHYPITYSSDWQYGYKQMVEFVTPLAPNYDRVMVTSKLGRPYIYFLLYDQIPQSEYLASRKAERDWFGLWNVYGFGKFDFTPHDKPVGEKVLQVAAADEHVTFAKKLGEIKSPKGDVVFEIGEP